ncbi:cytochrome c3 family protein [Thermodesulfobacteriota bacterium]
MAAVLVGFLCVGCGQDDNKQSTVEKRSPAGQAQEQEQMFTQETMDKIDKVAGPMLEKAGKTTGEVAAKVADKAEKARQRTEEFAAALKEESAPMIKKTGSALIVAGEKMQKAGVVLSAPETVVIDNKNGKVTLPHRLHGKSFGCKACHGDKEPGGMELGKAKAHKLCKECHKGKGKGPTKCSGCHVKKKATAVEGC